MGAATLGFQQSGDLIDKEDSDEEWQRVKNRKGKSSNGSSGGVNVLHGTDPSSHQDTPKGSKYPNPKPSILDRMSITFYVTNFPSYLTPKDLWNSCSKWGSVVDVFIAKRRSKSGKPFGFVRFIKVGNAEKLISGLRSIFFDKYRLFVDVEKYPRKSTMSNHATVKTTKNQTRDTSQVDSNNNGIAKKSFAEALADENNSTRFPSNRCVKLHPLDSNNDGSFNLLVKIFEPELIPYMRRWLYSEGFIDVEVRYLGGRWLQVSFKSLEAKKAFMDNESVKGKFSAIRSPSEFFVPDERMVWVNISGIPKAGWKKENIDAILGPWGKCIFIAADWINSYSMAKVCVLTQSKKFIVEELTTTLEDKTFDIWIREFDVWEPEILNVSYSETSSNNSDMADEDNGESTSEGDEYEVKSTNFDENLCKDHSVNSVGVDEMGGNSKSTFNGGEATHMDKEWNNHEPSNQNMTEDPFSLEGIIARETRNSKRAKSCPPTSRTSQVVLSQQKASMTNSSSDGAPGYIKGQFPAFKETDNHVSISGSPRPQQFGSTLNKECSSQGSSFSAAQDIINMGLNMGFKINGNQQEVEQAMKIISDVDGHK